MMETRYFKDMNHNYLIIKIAAKENESQYQLKMMIENDIPGLLKLSQRYIDGESFLYYEINSLQTLKSMFEHRKMDKQMAKLLLGGLMKVFRQIKNYLLSDDGLLLNPEFIYFNLEKEEVHFVFYPYENESVSVKIRQLFEYLVRIIDHNDSGLTDKIYDLCQLAEKKILSIEDFDRCLTELSLPKNEAAGGDEVCFHGTKTEVMTSEEINVMPKEININQTDHKKQKGKFLLLTLISTAGAIIILLYQSFAALTANEILLSVTLLIVFIIFFLITLSLYLLLVYRLKNTGRKERALDADFNPQAQSPVQSQVQPEYCGETIFLAEDFKEDKLYGFGRGNKYIIELTHFPFTIGKLDDNIDFCMKELSISRIHVRFTKYDDAVFMTDLNSTNGTYKNGLRLEPSETVPIAAGDEIRLGKLNFYYR